MQNRKVYPPEFKLSVVKEYLKIFSMPEISFSVLSNRFEYILRNNTNVLFDILDKEKEREKMQRMADKGNRRND